MVDGFCMVDEFADAQYVLNGDGLHAHMFPLGFCMVEEAILQAGHTENQRESFCMADAEVLHPGQTEKTNGGKPLCVANDIGWTQRVC